MPFGLVQTWVQRIVWCEPTCFPFMLFRNKTLGEAMNFFASGCPQAWDLGGSRLLSVICPYFPIQPFPHCSINSIPCFNQTGPLTLSQWGQPLPRWVHPLGCPLSFLSILSNCYPAFMTQLKELSLLAFPSYHHQPLPHHFLGKRSEKQA